MNQALNTNIRDISQNIYFEYVKTGNNELIEKLWEIMGPLLSNSICKKYSYYRNLIGLEYDDYVSISYIIFIESIKKISIKENELFFNKFFMKCIWNCHSYLRKYRSSGNKILNNYYKYDDYYLENKLCTADLNEEIIKDIHLEDIKEEIINKLLESGSLSEIDMEIFELYLREFKTKEIQKILNIQRKHVEYSLRRTLKILKKYFNLKN